jgi:hypothetical protein
MKSIGRFLIVFVLLSVPVFAADVTLFAGGQSPSKITLSRVTSGTTDTLSDPMNAGLFGLRFGGGRVWGHEETIAYAPNFLESSSKAIFLNSNLVVQAPLPVFKPYVTAGLGSIFSWGSGLGDIGSKFAVNYGGGIKLLPAGPVGVRFDARGYSAFGVQEQTLKLGEVSVGILFSFSR